LDFSQLKTIDPLKSYRLMLIDILSSLITTSVDGKNKSLSLQETSTINVTYSVRTVYYVL